ncbi:MAG TPA: hypothetical protein VH044_02480, partial [Polyangiaceae bacterium]|nr:hypothetical protein [Polyangiaceae bacterium]
LRELMQFAKADGASLTEKAQTALDELTTEIGSILKGEEKSEKTEAANGGAPGTLRPPAPIDVEVMRRDVPRGVGE